MRTFGSLPVVMYAVVLAVGGCVSSSAPCASPEGELVAGVTCGRAAAAVDLVGALTGRRPNAAERGTIYAEIAARPGAASDVAALEVLLAEARQGDGVSAGTARSQLLYDVLEGEGRSSLSRESHPGWAAAARRLAAVQAKDDAARLVLTEADVEAWIQYASLLREIQVGDPLKLSIAQREQLYRTLATRFREAPLEEKEALVALGAVWPAFIEAWRSASYERQQAFIQRAPMPPPVDATSLAYAEHALAGAFRPHAEALTAVFRRLPPGPAP